MRATGGGVNETQRALTRYVATKWRRREATLLYSGTPNQAQVALFHLPFEAARVVETRAISPRSVTSQACLPRRPDLPVAQSVPAFQYVAPPSRQCSTGKLPNQRRGASHFSQSQLYSKSQTSRPASCPKFMSEADRSFFTSDIMTCTAYQGRHQRTATDPTHSNHLPTERVERGTATLRLPWQGKPSQRRFKLNGGKHLAVITPLSCARATGYFFEATVIPSKGARL